MKNRTIAIVGAGAVLDFDYHGQITPSTNNITKELVNVRLTNINGKDSELVKKVYVVLKKDFDNMDVLYRNTNANNVGMYEVVNFEVLFYAIESLYSYSKGWQNDKYPFDRYPYPWLASLIKMPFEYDREEYRIALLECTKKIIEIVDAYDARFENGEISGEWYKDFWKSFGNAIDVFTFNYDNTIENSLGKHDDGFVELIQGVNHGMKRFEPEVLWYNKRSLPTISHLHGNIKFGLADIPELRQCYGSWDLYKYQAIDYEGLQNRMFFNIPSNQAREDTIYYPIITGLRKTDKLCYMPSNFYHAFFAQRILRNHSMLIVGCSFGDLYANQLIERHRLIHGDKQRIVIIDYWQLNKKDDVNCLFNYVDNNTSSGLYSILFHLLCDGRRTLLVESNKDMVQRLFCERFEWKGDYWALKDGRLRIYIDGFKDVVENHKKEITDYLNR